jgi:hypothetical protein
MVLEKCVTSAFRNTEKFYFNHPEDRGTMFLQNLKSKPVLMQCYDLEDYPQQKPENLQACTYL